MTAFPNLTSKPLIGTQHELIDNSLKSQMANGMTLTRKQYSRQLHKYSLHYPAMFTTDLNTLLSFYESVNGGSADFTWTDDTDNQRNVRFDGNLHYKAKTSQLWEVDFNLQEV